MDLVSVFCRQITLFSAILVEEDVFSPWYVFGTLIKNNVDVAVWTHIRILYSVSLVFTSSMTH
jgi:hypothetical protein